MQSCAQQANNLYKKSLKLYEEAKTLFPFGTQLFSRRPELGPYGKAPIYFQRAKNAHFWDVDGNEFIDTVMGVGPIILGYCYDPVDDAAIAQIKRGIIGSVNHELEISLAKLLKEMIPCAEMVKFCKSGGDACAIAIRIARGYTGKNKVVFCGYHGWHDWYIAANLESGSILNKHLMPGINPKGVPSQLTDTCIPFEFNNLDNLKSVLEQNKDDLACIILEASRFKHPEKGFLEGVRELADKYNCPLIFDEVITGFRLAKGGAQKYYGITPDLATFAKAIGNGYPLAATVGKANIMASQHDNFISSTYWGETLSLAAGLATLNTINREPVIEAIHETGEKIISGLRSLATKHGLNIDIIGHQYDFSIVFNYKRIANKLLTLYMQEMIRRGVYVSGMVYICYTHTDQDIQQILNAADETFQILGNAISNDDIDKHLKCPVRTTGFRRLA